MSAFKPFSRIKNRAESLMKKLGKKAMRIEGVVIDHITDEEYELIITARVDFSLMRSFFSVLGLNMNEEQDIDKKHYSVLEQYFRNTFNEINRQSEGHLAKPFRMLNYHIIRARHIPSLDEDHTVILTVSGSYVPIRKE